MKRYLVAASVAFTAATTIPPSLAAQTGGTATQEPAASSEEQLIRKHLEEMNRALAETARQREAERPRQTGQRDVEWVFISTPRPQDRALAEEIMRVDEDFRRAKLAADRPALGWM